MNLPNKLTMLRIILIPIMVLVNYLDSLKNIFVFDLISLSNLIMLSIFILASITDFLDGYIARKYNLVTTFGKFMDPLADKMLTSAAFLIFVEQGLIPAWIIVVILSREFIVSGVRLLAVESGKVIAASNLGKYKTIIQIFTIIIFYISQDNLLLGNIFLYLSLFLTIVSGLDYLIKNKNVFK